MNHIKKYENIELKIINDNEKYILNDISSPQKLHLKLIYKPVGPIISSNPLSITL
jgi:hypothetical protein